MTQFTAVQTRSNSLTRPTPLSPTASDDCQNWICIAREVEQQSLASQTSPAIAVSYPSHQRRPSPLLLAATILSTVLLGSVVLMQSHQVATTVLNAASADFSHQNF